MNTAPVVVMMAAVVAAVVVAGEGQWRLAAETVGIAALLLAATSAWSARRAERACDVERARLEIDLQRMLFGRRCAERAAAERDHELCNGLSSLAGITLLLGNTGGSPAGERLRGAVTSELERLLALVEGRSANDGSFPVGPVLHNLAALRRSTGLPTNVHVPPELQAGGDRTVVVQVLTNLLANCRRHAPGSTVWLAARRCGERVVLEVRDNGPGVPEGAEEAVFGRAVCDSAAGGQGLGLFLCRRLLAADGGTVRLGRGDGPPEAPGCVVTVDLPAAPAEARPAASTRLVA
jgi:two-component system, OmpR family, sensor kinase